MWLTRLALKNPVLIAMVTLALAILGMISLNRLPIDVFPNINLPILRVATLYPGASPQDIENTVTYPVEKAVSGLSNVDHIESVSKEGVSLVSVWLNWSANLSAAMVEANNRIQQILNLLPTGVQSPFIIKYDLANIPVCAVDVSGGSMDERQLYDLGYNVIEPQFEQLPGVASAVVSGGKIRQITVAVDRERMAAVGLSLLDLSTAINGANLLEPAGWIKVGNRQYGVTTNVQLKMVDRINDVVAANRNGIPITLGMLGHAVDSSEDQSYIVRINGQRGVYMAIYKQPGQNTVQVVDAVREALDRLVGIPPGIKLAIFFDESTYIRKSIMSLRREALQGALLAFGVILFFLQSLRATAIISLAIPLSILATFLLLYLDNQSLNIFSLGGLALAVGRLVDDSIVELENIVRHFAITPSRRKALLDAANEVAMPILASTITTVIVFLPSLFTEGVGQILFTPLAIAVTCSLLASFLVSRTVTPLLCLRYLDQAGHRQQRSYFTARASDACKAAVDWVERVYRHALVQALAHRGLIVVAVIGFAAVSALLIRGVGVEFMPVSDESQFHLSVRLPVGTRIELTEQVVGQIEDEIRRDLPPGWITIIQTAIGLLTTAGRASARQATYSSNTGPHAAQISVHLVDPASRSKSTKEVVDYLRPILARKFPAVKQYMDPAGLITRVLYFGSAAPIDVLELGYDLSAGAKLARQIARIMRNMQGLADIQINREENFPEFDIDVDREKAALAGIYQYDATHAILDSTNGSTSSPSIYIDPVTGNEYNIVVQYQDEFRSHVHDLGDTFLVNRSSVGDRTRNMGVIRLRTLASVKPGSGPIEIDRKYLQRSIDITANPVNRDLGGLAQELEERLAKLALPQGFSLRLTGQVEQQRGAFHTLAGAAALAMILVYMVLAAQFRSLVDPVIIMFSVPLGMAGVVWALFLTHTAFSVSSLMGVIMMVGIVVSNGVLMVHYTNLLRTDGCALHDAVVEAACVRLRPILMTTVATLAALLPMALGLGEGSETNAPLARSLIGGLSLSTLLTLFFIPALYTILEERATRRRQQARVAAV
jgi:CzcA family heavy metal efflux pump